MNKVAGLTVVLLALTGPISCADPPDEQGPVGSPGSAYLTLKAACGSEAIVYQDFTEEMLFHAGAGQNEWEFDGMSWLWVQGQTPALSGDYLVLTSTKGSGSPIKEEAQSTGSYDFAGTGELIVGMWSDRWSTVPPSAEHWSDTSIGMELYDAVHYGTTFTFGNLGAFADPDGTCPDESTCLWSEVHGWKEVLRHAHHPLAIRLQWKPAGSGATFSLHVADEPFPRAKLDEVDFLTPPDFRIRLNANVTDADKLPAEDSERLYVDFVCLRQL